jgi:murein DD-endopeptidase MepM/ murein hydrolase activator NlpD
MKTCFFERDFNAFILIGKKVVNMIKRTVKRILSLLADAKDYYYVHVNTRAKRIAVRTTAAFCGGAVICCIIVTVSGRMNTETGVGGLETTGVPEFSENMLGSSGSELDAAASVLSRDAGKDSTLYYQTYRVKQGDMIGIIADAYGVTQDTIISVNGIRQSRLLQVGQYLKIPSMPGILYTVKNDGETPESIAEKYEVSADKCAKVNSLKKDASLDSGTTLFVPDAQFDWVTRQEINGDLFIRPVRSRYWLSSYYGWRESPFTGQRSFHTGIDMACPMGTSVYAALAGQVSSIGFNATYGNYIIVSHHSGYKTLYGHLSAILVVTGQNVDTSTRIGKVGNTGLSTGPHLHFTVFKSGKTVNPLGLLK